jgi:hypothetical protein
MVYTTEMEALAEEAAFQMLNKGDYGKALKLWEKLYQKISRRHPLPSFDKAEVALRGQTPLSTFSLSLFHSAVFSESIYYLDSILAPDDTGIGQTGFAAAFHL